MNATFSLTLVIFVTFIVPVPMGITVVSVTITMVLPLTLSPFPRYYHKFVPITAVLPLSPSPCSSLPSLFHSRLKTYLSTNLSHLNFYSLLIGLPS